MLSTLKSSRNLVSLSDSRAFWRLGAESPRCSPSTLSQQQGASDILQALKTGLPGAVRCKTRPCLEKKKKTPFFLAVQELQKKKSGQLNTHQESREE